MEDNPYASPPAISPEESSTPARPKQPLGVSIVALLLALPGIVIGILLIGMTLAEPHAWEQFAAPRPGTILAVAIILQVGVISGIGTWLRCRWAWHLALLYCALPVYSSVNGWVAHGLAPNIGEVAFDVFHIFAGSYLCLRRPRHYFGVSNTTAIVSVFGACAGAMVFYHLMTWVALPLQWAIGS